MTKVLSHCLIDITLCKMCAVSLNVVFWNLFLLLNITISDIVILTYFVSKCDISTADWAAYIRFVYFLLCQNGSLDS